MNESEISTIIGIQHRSEHSKDYQNKFDITIFNFDLLYIVPYILQFIVCLFI